MIIAAGLSPAWQTIMRFDRIAPGEVNRAGEVHHFASGKVLNVAVALTHLGESAKAITIVGGPPRDAIDREFSALGISRHWVVTQAATRACVTLLESATGTTTELVENASPIRLQEVEEFQAVFAHDAQQASAVVLTGSLPVGVDAGVYAELMSGVRCPVILDARGPELVAALAHRPWLVKPNREELAATVGRPLPDDDAVSCAMSEVCERGAQRVLVSDGARPAWLLDDGRFYRCTPPRVEAVVNPIGCGDCLTAGIAVALVRGRSAIDCIAYGMAAAAENVTQLLAARIDPARVERRVNDVRIEPVS